MLKIFKRKLLWIALLVFPLVTTCCFASSDTLPISEDGSDVSDVVATDEEAPEVTEDTLETTYKFVPYDIYRADSDVVVSEVVDGNAFVVGNNVTISGSINGDLFVCASTLTIEETSIIYGRIFACASNMVINGMAYDIYAIADKMTMGENAYVERDVKVAANSMILNGMINRNVYCITDDLQFPDNTEYAIINGNLEYISSHEMEIADGVVTGSTTFTLQETDEENFSIGALMVSCINKVLSAVLYGLAVLLLIVWLAPNFIQKSGNLMRKKTPVALGIGLLTFIGTIIGAIALLFLTYGLGGSISFAVITLLVLTLTISETIFALAGARLFARKIHKEKTFQIILYTLLNIFIINVLKLIPLLGSILSIVITLIGLGYIMVNLIFKKQDFMTYENTDSAIIEES